METLYCPHCKKEQNIYTSEQEFSNGTKHIRADCDVCGRYIKYLPQFLSLEETTMPFGVYKGEGILSLKKDYIEFLINAKKVKGSLLKKLEQVLEIKTNK